VTPASELNQWGHVMRKFEYRFDIAAILLASVLTVLGISTAQAGGKGGVRGGDVRSRSEPAGVRR
jgi:hypothetical protein